MCSDTTSTNFMRDLGRRGLLCQATATGVETALFREQTTGYIGFDPTAASLHVGSLLPVLGLVRLQRSGHRPIAIVGGGTGLIGDPSGKENEREMLTAAKLEENLHGLRSQLERFLDFEGSRAAKLLNNADWLCELDLIAFLRDVGKDFSVNQMVARESVKRRLEGRDHGISFTEFSYALLQAYDFLWLYRNEGCTLQMGGSDQWGNILSGCDLIRRNHQVVAHGVTFPLVTRSDGSKFGKSEGQNIWLDAALTSPYEFFQFWFNADDGDVVTYLHYFTDLDQDRLNDLTASTASRPQERAAQKALACAVTSLVHGPTEADRARDTSETLFSGDWRDLDAQALEDAFAGSPRSQVAATTIGTAEGSLVSLVVHAELSKSRGQARKAIESGAISVNGRVVTDTKYAPSRSDVLAGGYIVLKRGKKTFHVLKVS